MKRASSSYFWSKVAIAGDDDCWEWTGYRDARGYGRYGRILAHRVAFEYHYQVALGEQIVRHSCDNPACVNPQHLCAGTQADNVADMIARGRRSNQLTRRGEACNKSKLSEVQVREILTSSASGASLARKFGVSSTAVYWIRQGRNWSHLI